jgi:hypothetical protein
MHRETRDLPFLSSIEYLLSNGVGADACRKEEEYEGEESLRIELVSMYCVRLMNDDLE